MSVVDDPVGAEQDFAVVADDVEQAGSVAGSLPTEVLQLADSALDAVDAVLDRAGEALEELRHRVPRATVIGVAVVGLALAGLTAGVIWRRRHEGSTEVTTAVYDSDVDSSADAESEETAAEEDAEDQQDS